MPIPGAPGAFFRNSTSGGVDYIKNGLLVGVNSILLPPRCLEASGVKFSWGDVFVLCIPTSEKWIRDQTLPTSLRTLWEWKNRVLLEEHHVFNEAIPPEVLLFLREKRQLSVFYRFFRLSWETSTINNYHSQDSEHSGSGRIEFSSKSTTLLM